MSTLARKAFSILQRDLFLFVTNVATGIVIARTLGPEALGGWVALQLVPAYAESLGRVKVDVAAVYVLGTGRFRQESVLLNINLVALASSGVVVAVLALIREVLLKTLFGVHSAAIRGPYCALLLLIPLQSLYLNYSYFHIASEEVGTFNRMTVVRALTNSLIAIPLLVLARIGLWGMVIASVVSCAAGLVYGWARVNRSSFAPARLDWALLRELGRQGLHLYSGGILGQLAAQGTKTVVAIQLASSEVAFFGQAQGIGELLSRFPAALGTILFPRISRSTLEAANELAGAAYRTTLVVLLASGGALAIGASRLIPAVYGVSFTATVQPLLIMIPGFVVAGAASSLAVYFQGIGRSDLIPKLQLAPLLLQIGSAVPLTAYWGLRGAAAALSFGMLSLGAVQARTFLKLTNAPARVLVPGIRDVRLIWEFAASRVRWSRNPPS